MTPVCTSKAIAGPGAEVSSSNTGDSVIFAFVMIVFAAMFIKLHYLRKKRDDNHASNNALATHGLEGNQMEIEMRNNKFDI